MKKTYTPKENEHEYDDEWSGFSDDETREKATQDTEHTEESHDNKPETNGSKEKKQPKKEKQEKQEKKQKKDKENGVKRQDRGIQPSLSFAALEDVEEDGVDVSAWDPLGLSPELQTSLSKLKFTTPTAVQKTCIPEILAGHDVVGKASTGSGKTLAFGIPILEHYLDLRRSNPLDEADEKKTDPIALILSPTRELAHQLAKHIGDLNTHAPDTNAHIALLTGGLSIQKQQRLLADADIVIGTPGRVWEIMSTGQGLIRKMQKIKFLVVDEADRLLSEGHFKEVEEIIKSLDRTEENGFPEQEASDDDDEDEENQRQTLVFSATFHRGLQQKLAGKGRFFSGDLLDKKESMEYLLKKLNFREERPKFMDVNPVQQMAEGLKEGIVECPAMEKVGIIHIERTIQHYASCFSNMIAGLVSLHPAPLPPQASHIGLHQLYFRRAPTHSVSSKSKPTCPRPSLLNGSKSPSSLR